MSTDNPTRHMAQPELIRLGDRMLARAISTLFDLRPERRPDMLLCVGCLRIQAQENPEGVTITIYSDFTP
jgi:hypothetical protein